MGTCPNCGVAVAAGYPRCPKCQAVLPASRRKRATFRDEAMAGGTSIASPDGGGSRASWIAALAILLVGAGIAVYFATRGGTPKPVAPDGDEEVVEGDDDDTAAAQAVEPEQPAPTPGKTAPPPPGEPRAYAARQVIKRIDEALRVERLWAKVTSDDDVLVIESSLCGQPGVQQVVKGEVDGLRAAGFVTVRCQSPNGRVEFESGI